MHRHRTHQDAAPAALRRLQAQQADDVAEVAVVFELGARVVAARALRRAVVAAGIAQVPSKIERASDGTRRIDDPLTTADGAWKTSDGLEDGRRPCQNGGRGHKTLISSGWRGKVAFRPIHIRAATRRPTDHWREALASTYRVVHPSVSGIGLVAGFSEPTQARTDHMHPPYVVSGPSRSIAGRSFGG